jgi:hypothetical protein
MKFLTLTALLLSALSMPAFGAESHVRCSSADGAVLILDGKFFEHGRPVNYPYVNVYGRRLVKTDRKFCRLTKAGRDVIAYDYRAYKQHIIYSSDDTREADLVCEEVTHAIPAGDSCAN